MTESEILNRIDKLNSLFDVEELKMAIFALADERKVITLFELLKTSVLRMAAKEHPLASKMAAILV